MTLISMLIQSLGLGQGSKILNYVTFPIAIFFYFQVQTFKARLVAKGYRQHQGVDYKVPLSQVIMLKSIRIMLDIAIYYDYEI